MKTLLIRLSITVVLAISVIPMFSQITIPMQQEDGVYRVPCKINGAKMKLVFDTGASSVSLSLSMAQYLYDNEFITDSDIVEQGQSQTADGRIVDHLEINIKDFEIGGMHIENVSATVIAAQTAPLLMGQSAIQKLGRIQIEGSNLILLDGICELTDEEIDEYAEIADKAMKNYDYEKSELYYSKLYDGGYLNNCGLWEYAFACRMNNNYKKALQVYKELENSEYSKADAYNIVTISHNLFYEIAQCYIDLGMEYLIDCYVAKAVAMIPPYMKLASGKSIATDEHSIPIIYCNIAASLMEKEHYGEAAQYYWEALGSYAKHYKISTTAIWNIMLGKVKNLKISKDESIQHYAFNWAKCRWLSYVISDAEFNTIVLQLAHNNNERARMFCNENNIKY